MMQTGTLLTMAEHVAHHPRSGRFIKVYLFMWGLLAAGGLTYLASLAWQPDWLTPPPPRPQVAEPDAATRMATKAVAEVRDVRRTVGDMQRSLGEMKETLDQTTADNRTVQTRLSTLEGRVTELASQPPGPVAAAPAPAAPRQKAVERTQVKIVPVPKAGEAHAPARDSATRVMSAIMQTPDKSEPSPPSRTPLETGSIASAPITFGEPVVTRAQTSFAVQLGAGRSLDALRMSWSLLLDQHGDSLSPLQPRVIAPPKEGGSYRLVAGPFDTRSAAEKVCAAMNLQRNKCFSVPFAGEPL
jgi:hypothetical protein